MEKAVYALWRPDAVSEDDFNGALMNEIAPRIAKDARAVRINLKDAAVADGASPRSIATDPQMDAIIQIWLDTAQDAARAPIDQIIERATKQFDAWLVSEAAPIVNTIQIVPEGTRLPGFSQIVFLRRPADMTWDDWRETWQQGHTGPAIETQSNFEYLQNLVVRPLTENAVRYDAIIEECFPIEALTDPLTYFDAPGDPEKMQANLKIMMDSVKKFIDHARMDCFPTSQYDIKRLS